MIIGNILVRTIILSFLLAIFILSFKKAKLFILIYLASRSLLAIFYDIKIFGSANILYLAGFFFPAFLLLYWFYHYRLAIENRRISLIYLGLSIWVMLSLLIRALNYGWGGMLSLAGPFRLLNGLAVFLVFPLIFRTSKDIHKLTQAFFIGTLFPLGQGLIQIASRSGGGLLRSSLSQRENAEIVMYYGLYDKYDGYAWASLVGGLFIIFKIRSLRKNNPKKAYRYYLLYVLYLILASLTLSRTLFISLAVITVFMIVNIKGKKERGVFIIVLALLLGGNFYQERLSQLLERSSGELKIIQGEQAIEAGFHGRIFVWKRIIEEFDRYSFPEKMTGTPLYIGPHGDYVQWLLSYGYIGVAIYVSFLFVLLTAVVRKLKSLRRASDSSYYAFGVMVLAGLLVWILEGIIHNVSHYVDYSYVILGSTAIFLAVGKEMKTPLKMSQTLQKA